MDFYLITFIMDLTDRKCNQNHLHFIPSQQNKLKTSKFFTIHVILIT